MQSQKETKLKSGSFNDNIYLTGHFSPASS